MNIETIREFRLKEDAYLAAVTVYRDYLRATPVEIPSEEFDHVIKMTIETEAIKRQRDFLSSQIRAWLVDCIECCECRYALQLIIFRHMPFKTACYVASANKPPEEIRDTILTIIRALQIS